MRKAGLILGIAAAGIVVLLAVILLAVDVNRYRGVVQSRLEQQLGREVTLGEMSLGLFPVRFRVEDTVIAEDPGFDTTAPFVQAESLDVRVSLLSLIRGDVRVRSLELERPSVELVKDAGGVWNFSSLGTGDSEADAAPEAAAGERRFALDRLRVLDGRVAVTDLGQGERAVYDHIDLTLLDYAPGQPFAFDLAAHLEGEGAQELRLDGDGGPVSTDNPLDTPFQGTLSLDEVGIDGLRTFFDTGILSNAAGSLSGESEITNQPGSLAAAGNLRLEDARFNDLEIGYPISFDYDAAADPGAGLYTIHSATLGLGETPLTVAGSVNTDTTPLRVDLHLTSGDVPIAELARLASALGVAFAPETSVRGRVRVDVEARGEAARPALTGDIQARDLQISGMGIPQPVEIGVLDLALTPAEIRSNEFDAASGTTRASVRFAILEYTSDSPRIDASLRAPGATLPEIQSIARAYGITGLDQISGEGTLDLDLAVAGPLESLSTANMLGALDGAIDLDFSPLEIAGFDLPGELGAIGGFPAGSAGQNVTDILRLAGHIDIADGIARTDDLLAELAIGNVSAAGTADLAAASLDLRLSAVLSRETSDRVGSTGIGGYLTTALSNDAGELVIPVLMTGTFRQPMFAPDVRTFAEMQRQRLLPTFDDPAAAVSDLLEALSGRDGGEEEGEDEEAPAEPTPADRIRGILGGLLGGEEQDATDESNEP